MKPFKTALILIMCLALSAKAFSQQISSMTVVVNENQCDTITSNLANGGQFDSIVIITQPQNGVAAATNTFLQYCPNQGFVGQDVMQVYQCTYSNGLFLGCDTLNIYLEVQVPCSLSVALVADTSTCPGGLRHFTALITGGTAPYTYVWSNSTNGSGACELNAGQGLCVTVSDANGCYNTTCSSNNNCQISVALYPDSLACNGQLGLTTTLIGGTAPYNYYWSTGDTGSTLCGANGGLLAGTNYCVDVTDAGGCFGYTCYTISAPGNCSFQYSQQGINLQSVAFYGSYDASYTLSSVSWNFGDGTTGNVISPVHYYTNSGTYDVTMTLYYSTGDSCSSQQWVYVYNDSLNNYPYCQAYFNTYVSNDTVYFYNQSVYGSTTSSWDFGDGTTSTLNNPYHVYNSQGTWTVCLTTTSTDSANGNTLCTSNYCQVVSNVPVQDMQAYLFHASTVTPGFPLYTYLEYYNNGTILMNGTIVYSYPVGTSFVSSQPGPAAIDVSNHLITYNYSSLTPGSSGYIFVDLAADSSLPLASLVYDTMWVNPINGDLTPGDNVSSIIDSVVGSWDPNGKSVSPKGRGARGEVEDAIRTVAYTIHFQNTGNAPANTIIVRDTLSDNIDLSTVTVTYASHPHVAQVIGNVLVVSFANINLPDTGASLLASQGSIAIRANLKPGLTPGTQVFNTGNIYFDANAPVITNTVITTLKGGTTGISAVSNIEFALLPNPTSAEVMIRGTFNDEATYQVEDMLGKELLQGRMPATGTTVNVAPLSAGIYLVKVKSGVNTGVQRLVVVK